MDQIGHAGLVLTVTSHDVALLVADVARAREPARATRSAANGSPSARRTLRRAVTGAETRARRRMLADDERTDVGRLAREETTPEALQGAARVRAIDRPRRFGR